jgi:fatty acid desaturase
MGLDRLDLDEQLKRFAKRLPPPRATVLRWLRRPGSAYVRIPAAIVLIAGGFVGFLPILGFWMVPFGLVLIAQDLPFLRGPMARLLAWINRKWPAKTEQADARTR